MLALMPAGPAEASATPTLDAAMGLEGDLDACGLEGGPLVADDSAAQQELEAALGRWRETMLAMGGPTEDWLAANLRAFVGLDKGRAQLAWGDSQAAAAVAELLGGAISGGLAAGGASIGAGLGLSLGGPPGAVAGFLLGVLSGIAGSAIVGLAFPATSADELKFQASKESGARRDHADAVVRGAFAGFPDHIEAALVRGRSAGQAMTVACLRAELARLDAELSQLSPPDPCDRSLFQRMMQEWVLENAGDPRSASERANSATWREATASHEDEGMALAAYRDGGQQCPPTGDPAPGALHGHLDLFAYQTRGLLAEMGLPLSMADWLFEEAREAERLFEEAHAGRDGVQAYQAFLADLESTLLAPSRAGEIVVHTSRADDRQRFAAFCLGQAPDKSQGLLPPRLLLQRVAENRPFTALCAPRLRFDAASHCIHVGRWNWTVVVPGIDGGLEFTCWP